MILYEYEAKRLFREQGISIPQGEVIRTPEEAEEVVRKMGKPATMKPQVLAGWWGKAGDIQFANTPVEAARIVEGFLKMPIDGQTVVEVLVEERPTIQKEIYLAIRVDGAAGGPLVLASLERLGTLTWRRHIQKRWPVSMPMSSGDFKLTRHGK
jgi:succinyl-CoA synthetase beta subunit